MSLPVACHVAAALALAFLPGLPAVAQQVTPAATTAPPAVPPEQTIRAAVLRVDPPSLPPISRLDARPDDLGFAGTALATEDNATTGRFMGQSFQTDTVVATPDEAQAKLSQILADGTRFVVVLADDATTLALTDAARAAAPDALILNARAGGDNLRNADCRANLVHVAPSRAMLTDALAQFLMTRQWGRWVLAYGSHPDDEALRGAYTASARKFNARIVAEKSFPDTGGARRTDTGHVLVERQIPVDTQFGKDYDVLVAADENGVFAAYLPYLTWDARPVAGSAGLTPHAWHPAMEAWGGMQFQNRFERLAHRPMRDDDYLAWLALRMLGQAATQGGSADPATIRAQILDPAFQVAGFKGEKLSLRNWDHQLRQPILLASRDLVVSVSPQEGYLHQSSQLDTLGTDRPETQCHF